MLVLAVSIHASPSFAAESFEEQLKRAGALLGDRPRAALSAFDKLERSRPDCAEGRSWASKPRRGL
jgi:hypothetical protein